MSGTGRFGEDTRYGAVPLETLESSPVKSNSPLSAFFFFFFFINAVPPHTHPVRKASPNAAGPSRLMCRGVGRAGGPSRFPAALGGFGARRSLPAGVPRAEIPSALIVLPNNIS